MNKIIKDILGELTGKDRLIELTGLILLVLFAFSQITFLFKFLGIVAGLMMINYARLKINTEKLIKFEKLKPGSYLFMTIPVQEKKCSITGNCCQYYVFVERSVGGVIPVEIGVAAGIAIERRMGKKKSISQIVGGEEFLVR